MNMQPISAPKLAGLALAALSVAVAGALVSPAAIASGFQISENTAQALGRAYAGREAAGNDASVVSALPAVRAALLAFQHDAARLPGLVTDGRDMGTVVFPHAALKVFLTANARVRAQRRLEQLRALGVDAKIDSLYADLRARDQRDTHRKAAPLQAAEDAMLLDNSGLSIEQSVAQVLGCWQKRQPFHAAS